MSGGTFGTCEGCHENRMREQCYNCLHRYCENCLYRLGDHSFCESCYYEKTGELPDSEGIGLIGGLAAVVFVSTVCNIS